MSDALTLTVDQLVALSREQCAQIAERVAAQMQSAYSYSDAKHVCKAVGQMIALEIRTRSELPAVPVKSEALRIQQWGLFYRHARPFIRTGLALLLMMRRNPAFAKDSYALADNFLAELEKDLAVWEKHDGG